jgi:hypothetical protein
VKYGCGIIFHAQLVHAGAAYTQENDRLFTYIGTHVSQIPQNALGMKFPLILGVTQTQILLSKPN